MRQVCRRLEGAFTLVAVHADEPDVVVGARRNSPLVVGVGDGENFLASDVAAFIAHTRDAIELGQDQVVELRRDGVTVTDFDGAPADVREYHVDWDASAAEKGGYAYFMLKEIAEQPKAVADTLLGRIDGEGALHLDEVRIPTAELREVDKVVIVACGTAFHAGMIAKYAIEHWTRIPCEVELASEFRYRDPILDPRTLVIAISQSGETMDTLMAVRHAREQGSRVLAICNTNGSTIPRESDAVLYTHAGPEIAVASTKAFLTQIVACYLVGLYLARCAAPSSATRSDVMRQLNEMPGEVEKVLETIEPVRELARCSRTPSHRALPRPPRRLPGRARRRAQAQGARLHARRGLRRRRAQARPDRADRGGPAGRRDRAVAARPRCCTTRSCPTSRRSGPAARTRSSSPKRATRPSCPTPTPSSGSRLPTLMQPLVTTVPLQVFACELATAKGHDVDQPRNLAKSVTVE